MSEPGPVDPDRTREVPEAPPLHRSTVDRWAAPRPDAARPDARAQRSSFIGMAGMPLVLFVILASGAVLAVWAMALLVLVWGFALVQSARWFMTHPSRVVATPVLLIVLWLAVLYAGAAWLGWG